MHHHPLPTARSVAAFCSYPHHRLQWSLVTEGHSSLWLSGPVQQYPPGLSPSIITGNFISGPCWAHPPIAFESEGFFPFLKGLVIFTAWYWNPWTEPSHSSAKLDRFQLPRSRKLVMLQLSLFSCLNHPIFLRLCPQWQRSYMASETGDGSCQRSFAKPFKARGDFTMFPISKQSYSIWLFPAVLPVSLINTSLLLLLWEPSEISLAGWSFLMQTWCNVPACPIPGRMTSPEPQQTTATPRCATFSTIGLLVLFRLSYTLESATQYFTGLQNCPTDQQ